jgi:uncharacterized protein (TIGR02466 family)
VTFIQAQGFLGGSFDPSVPCEPYPPMSIPNSVLQKEHVAITFGTPVSSYLWPDSDALNAALKKVVLEKEKADQGMKRSNVGGWHSKPDLFLWQADCVHTLKDRVATCASDMTRLFTALEGPRKISFQLDCWANISRRGAYNSVHDHPGAMWSGVYYISGGEPDGNDPLNGKLELLDPRVGVNMLRLEQGLFGGRYLVDPLPGLMVMFPSWLKHMVHPFSGSGERISTSFNAYVQIQQQTK